MPFKRFNFCYKFNPKCDIFFLNEQNTISNAVNVTYITARFTNLYMAVHHRFHINVHNELESNSKENSAIQDISIHQKVSNLVNSLHLTNATCVKVMGKMASLQ